MWVLTPIIVTRSVGVEYDVEHTVMDIYKHKIFIPNHTLSTALKTRKAERKEVSKGMYVSCELDFLSAL